MKRICFCTAFSFLWTLVCPMEQNLKPLFYLCMCNALMHVTQKEVKR
jgi:hypothetical protein